MEGMGNIVSLRTTYVHNMGNVLINMMNFHFLRFCRGYDVNSSMSFHIFVQEYSSIISTKIIYNC